MSEADEAIVEVHTSVGDLSYGDRLKLHTIKVPATIDARLTFEFCTTRNPGIKLSIIFS
jgi:hypothetical protein